MKQDSKQQHHDEYVTAKAKVKQLQQQAEAIQQRKADCLTRKAVLGIDLERAKKQSKNDEKATISLLQNIGPEICGRKVPPTMTKFKKDAGSLSGRISGDEKIASSQMMLFYVAPSRSVWDGAKYYKDQSYNPKQQPESFAKFTRETGGGLPYLVDAWEMPIFYEYDKNAKTSFVFSNGEDTLWNTPDDLIYDVRNNQVIKREAISQ